ncbi:hypothetical protein RND71_031446 [Anisodus tanguticus]|uniref:Uncharacterized protein n=1 Tax=Anisodus tanguticus TaxID=243964 RepID=A0AAE1RBA7_9SOLA|nr:hypothetical protein RND71_031446 [Anisodus tanguticus]
MNLEDGVTEKKGGKRRVKDSIVLVNEVGVNTRRSMRNKQVVIEEKREETEGVNDGLRMSRRVTSRKNAKESVEDMEELNKSKSETGTDRVEKRDKTVTFISDGKVNERAKSETKAKGMKRETRRKSMTLHVQNEVDAEVREEVAEKPAQVTRSWNLKPVVDNVSNKRNRTKGKEVIEISEELLCTEFVESSVDAVKDEVRLNTRRSQQNSVVEASQKANKAKGARLTDDICKEKMVTRGRTSNQSSLTVEASTSESGTKIVEPKGKLEVVLQLEEPVEVLLRRSDRRKSVFPLEKLRGDEDAAKKEKRDLLNANDDEPRNKGTTEEPHKALKRSKRLATQVEDSVLAKDDIAANEVLDRGRSTRRKSVVPSLEKVRSDEVAVVKEKRNLNANDDGIRSKGTKEEPRKASKRSKRLDKQMEDPVLAEGDIAENKLEERRCSRRNSAKGNVNTKILDRSVQEETSVVKEERRRSRRSAAMHTLAVVSDEKKENGEKKLTKKNCTVIQEKVSTNKLALQDLDSLQQSTSSSKASVEATVVEKTRSAGKKHQGRLKRSNVEVEVPMSEDMEIVRDPDNEVCNISGSEGTMSFSRSALNELEAVPGDVDIVLAETMDEAAAESSTLADKLNEEGPLIDANDSPSENNSASKCHPFNSDARPEENLVVELLQSDHEASASRDRSSSVLADDAVPNDITSDQQEHGAEEFISNEVLDNCSLSQSDNMENLDSGTKDEAAAELSTLADKLNEGPLVDANASPSENNSTSKCPPFSDPFNSNARPEENLVEELLQFDHKVSASKDLCPSSVFPDYGVPNDITSDKPEHGAMAEDNAEEFDARLSNEVLDNCSLSQSDNMEENLDSGFKEQSETGGVVTEGVTYGEQEPESKGLYPSSALTDDAVLNDITSTSIKQEHGAIAAEEFDIGLSNEVLESCSVKQSDNMEENLDAGFKEESETGCIVTEGVTYGEQEPASKGLRPSPVLADYAVPNDLTSDKLEHGAIAADNAKEFDTGSSNEVLDNCSGGNMEEELDSGFKEQLETPCSVTVGLNYGEQELTVTDYAKEFDPGLSSSVSLENMGAFNQSNETEVKNSESDPMEQAEAESGSMEAKYDQDAHTFTNQCEIHAEEYANLEDIALHVTPSEDSGDAKQGSYEVFSPPLLCNLLISPPFGATMKNLNFCLPLLVMFHILKKKKSFFGG